MKFSTKIIVSFTGATLLLLAIGITSQYLNNEVRNRVVEESQRAVQELQLAGDMGFNLYKSLVNTQYLLEERNRRTADTDQEQADQNLKMAEQRVQEGLENLQSSILDLEKLIASGEVAGNGFSENQRAALENLKNLKSKFQIYRSLIREMLVLMKQDYNDGREFFTVTIEPYFRDNLLPLVDELRYQSQNNLNEEISSLNAQLSDSSFLLFIATLVAFLVSILLAFYLYRSVAYPLNELTIAARHIGSGNLDQRIEVKTRDEVGKLAEEFNRMAENLSKTTVSRNFMDDIIESMTDSLVVTDVNGVIQRANSSTLRMLGYEESEIEGKELPLLFENKEKVERCLESNKTLDCKEANYLKKNGESIPVSLSLGTIRNSDDTKQGMVLVASDISQRKEAEQQITKSLKEKEILLAEIHHRVKNNLAVISGLLQMQIWETKDQAAENVLKDSQLRVQSIALVHEKLYQSESLSFIQFDRYIRDLLQAISSTYMDTHGSIDIVTELEDIGLNINQAIPCSLLLNELIVNAFKHAFDGEEEDGNIYVNIFKQNGNVHMSVKDDGIGFPEDFDLDNASSLGMTLINTLIKQLQGEITVKNDGGAIFEVQFKAEEVV
jgi:PAS domain S-box-containing protein